MYIEGGSKLMKTLRDAKIGDTVKVVKLHGEGAIKRRASRCMYARSLRSEILLRLPCAAMSCRSEKPMPI